VSAEEDARRFGELRSLLQHTPDEQAWAALCALIQAAPAQLASDALIPYALDHLRRWPDALRVATDADMDALMDEAPARTLALARHLDAGNRWIADGYLDALLTHAPRLRALRLQGSISDEGATRLAQSPALDTIERLDLASNQIGDLGAARLTASPHITALRHLDLSWNALRDEMPVAMTHDNLAALQTLLLEGSHAGAASCAQLKHAPFGGQLRTFAIGGRHIAGSVVGWIGWRSLVALDRAGFFANTRSASLPTNGLGIDDLPLQLPLTAPLATHALALQDNRLSGEALSALAPLVLPASLETLNLSSNYLSGLGVRTLSARPLHHLHTLHLTANHLGADDLLTLISTQNLPALITLHLDHNQASPAFATALASRPLPFALERLMLGSNNLTDAGLIALAQQPSLSSLRTLYIQECELSAEACRALATCAPLRGLRTLSLNHNIIGDEGAAWLAQGEWPALRELQLWRCGISDAGARALARAPWTAHLDRLDLTDNPIYQEGRDALAASPHLPEHLRTRFLGPPPKRRRMLPGEHAP
jgi:hypothetical protein